MRGGAAKRYPRSVSSLVGHGYCPWAAGAPQRCQVESSGDPLMGGGPSKGLRGEGAVQGPPGRCQSPGCSQLPQGAPELRTSCRVCAEHPRPAPSGEQRRDGQTPSSSSTGLGGAQPGGGTAPALATGTAGKGQEPTLRQEPAPALPCCPPQVPAAASPAPSGPTVTKGQRPEGRCHPRPGAGTSPCPEGAAPAPPPRQGQGWGCCGGQGWNRGQQARAGVAAAPVLGAPRCQAGEHRGSASCTHCSRSRTFWGS